MQVSSSLLDEVVQSLENHQESLRIKKLLFCICKKYWENNPSILHNFSIKDLLEELLESNTNVNQLNLALYQLVKTLNRPHPYVELAKFIIYKTNQLYAENNLQKNPITIETFLGRKQDSQINKITEYLENHQQSSRIKKLIFCVCNNRWENNANIIEGYDFKSLILEIIQRNPTRKDLEIAFKKVVANINKQQTYNSIANLIRQQLDVFYSFLDESKNKEYSHQSEQARNPTQIIPINNISIVSNNSVSQKPRTVEAEIAIIDLTPEQVTDLKKVQQQPLLSNYNPFDLRLEITQYTNPLRAKILLFSILYHPWDKTGQDWAMLRSYSLHDLLEQLISSGKSLIEIESSLHVMAKSLKDYDANMQTATTIIEAIKSCL